MACASLGVMYKRGAGVLKDSAEAQKWCRRAANCEKAAPKVQHLTCDDSGLSNLHANFLWAYALRFSIAESPQEFYEKNEVWNGSALEKCTQADCVRHLLPGRLNRLQIGVF